MSDTGTIRHLFNEDLLEPDAPTPDATQTECTNACSETQIYESSIPQEIRSIIAKALKRANPEISDMEIDEIITTPSGTHLLQMAETMQSRIRVANLLYPTSRDTHTVDAQCVQE
jgi:hypothetical protein